MSQQFNLSWGNTELLASSNSISQRALYRYKTVGGAYISTGFTPANDLATSVISVDSPVLNANKVVQFQVETICTVNGPATNDNGVQEIIGFECLTPALTKTDVTAIITLDVTGLDITKARFTLRKSSDNTLISGTPIIVNTVSNSITTTVSGLVASTNYYWQVELYANVNSIEVISSSSDYLGSLCSPYPFTTNAPAVCPPVTAITISSIEI